VCMAGQHTTSMHPNLSTYALTGAQRNWPAHWGLPPLGYPWNLECGSLGSVHAPPLATPAQNFPFTHGGDAKRGQSVVPPVMTDTDISDSLLPGLPPPPTGPVVFRQSSVVPAPAASGSSVSGQLNTSSTASALTSSVSGQPATAVTTSHTDPTSSGPTSTAAGKPLVFTDEPVAVPVASVTSSTSFTTSTMSTTGSSTTFTTTSPTHPSSVAVTGATTVTLATTTSGTTTPSSTTTTTLATASTSSAATVSTASVTAPVVVVRQLQTVRPYNGTTSWKLFRDHFNRVAKVNSWTLNDDLIQHLMMSLESAAAEVLRDFDDTASTALTDLWARLEHRFGEVDGCREAMRKFDA